MLCSDIEMYGVLNGHFASVGQDMATKIKEENIALQDPLEYVKVYAVQVIWALGDPGCEGPLALATGLTLRTLVLSAHSRVVGGGLAVCYGCNSLVRREAPVWDQVLFGHIPGGRREQG